jgi:hypothetical protein
MFSVESFFAVMKAQTLNRMLFSFQSFLLQVWKVGFRDQN